jgi:hypothetical protein
MIAKFKDEFEEHIETARMSRGLGEMAGSDVALAAQGALEDSQSLLAHVRDRAQAPGAHEGAPGTQRGGA